MNIPDDLSRIFANSLEEVVFTVAGVTLRVLPPECEADEAGKEMIGIMHLNGRNRGMLFISAAEDSIRALCAAMLGIPQHEVAKDDMRDALCELVNMTAGNAKLRLSNTDYTFTLTVPFLISGENMMIFTKKREPILSCVLSDDRVSLGMKMTY